MVPVACPVGSCDLDLGGMQARILGIDAVARVAIRVGRGGVLQVRITERIPAAVWRKGRDIELLDAQGHRVAVVASRTDRADLPLPTTHETLSGQVSLIVSLPALAVLALDSNESGPLLSRDPPISYEIS